ncbi:hypothetical protein [Mucilaginibacter sp.]
MEIKKTYDYLSAPDGIFLTAKVRSRLILRGRINYVIFTLIFSSFCLVLAINVQSNFMYFCGFMALLFAMKNGYTIFLVRKRLNEIKKSSTKTAAKIGVVTITFTDKVFIYRDNQQAIEYTWEKFSSFLIKNDFLFLVIENSLAAAICLDTKYFTENEFTTLKNFLQTKLPLYKQTLFK